MIEQIDPDPIDDLVRWVDNYSKLSPDPAAAQRVSNSIMAEWDRLNPLQKQQQRHNPFRITKWVRPIPIGLAASVLIVCAIVGVELSQASAWHSTEGQTHAQIRDSFPEFAALQAAPEALPTDATIAKPGRPSFPWPTLAGFEIRRKSLFYDMTWWCPVAPDKIQSGRISPVVYTCMVELRRKPGATDNKKLEFKFSTKGFAVDPVKIKPTDEIEAAKDLEKVGNVPKNKAYLLTTDVSDHPEGTYFTVVVHAIYWNGFNDPLKEDAAVSLSSSTAFSSDFSGDIGVLLPPKHSIIDEWSLWKIDTTNTELPENRLKTGSPPKDKDGILYWTIAHPESGFKYKMQWTWSAEGGKK